ncbi:outer membrane protein assembly factor BamE [Pseudomonas fulva]|uniref:outer membrane protein assembly factor BamE domain-containing protein n=1 Tax=Pseudomonas fulva TaxID=47880 RepID=UPI0018AB148E|nr:outer membrane protein assembly factor BamE [Pseudomonas fulva]MBF8676190.1 outer membrane protein assembly factor BamE [Pseudomonas fulva]MBF8698578.1 outer membrane protein assembly factor BamE [Pseudomonas fulva]
MLRTIRNSIVVGALTLIAACAGTPFTFGQASQVKVGMTEDQLYEIMGNPYMVVSTENGQRFVYSHATAFSGAKSVSFEVNEGKVTKVPYIPQSFIAKPSPDE